MSVEKAIEANQKARLYCMGKAPRSIKATKEFLQSWVDDDYSITMNKLAVKHGCHPRTIAEHAHALADILAIPRQPMPHLQNPTFYRYASRSKPRFLAIECPKCKHRFHVTFSGRVVEE